ncbi:type I phosphatidylinositol 4,5-bisphosphate 4-phosphatase-B-like [Centruroides vittatus]|uniref:type I phosphatidylinositol 4,5-bisphosphate 4-phosphatase-B-like n=1 Tax=Centruroides vittatus TaxID=120091 RepID=UPI00350ED747
MEKRALLQEENYNAEYGATAPSAPPYVEGNSSEFNVHVNETGEFPVQQNVFSERIIPTVSCRVCKCSIDISGKADQFVVQCENCHEATPIKLAPPGKKYVRCPCNCLLICKSTSQKISCPRPNCKRIISMAPSAFPTNNDNPGLGQVSCPHCQSVFMINTTEFKKVMRCVYCRRRVTFSSHYIKNRRNLCMILTLLFLISGIFTLVYTVHKVLHKPAIIAAYIGLFGFFLLCLVRTVYYYSVKPLRLETFTEST